MERAEFQMRATVIEDQIEELTIWIREFIPYGGILRSKTEWVDEAIRSGGASKLRDYLGVLEGDFQVIADGMLTGFSCGPYHEEYDEEIEYSNVELQLIVLDNHNL